MKVLIVGFGRTGSYLARTLAETGRHMVTAVERDRSRAEGGARGLEGGLERAGGPEGPDVRGGAAEAAPGGVEVIWGDGCEPSVLEEAGVRNADVVVATTGHDEDNLVVAQLAKSHFNVPRVIARVNNPRNAWLYTREWGVDVAVSATDIITKVIAEEMSLGDLVTLLKLRHGEVALAETVLKAGCQADGQLVSELPLPAGSVIVAVVRGGELIVPGGQTRLAAGDELLAITSVDKEDELRNALQ